MSDAVGKRALSGEFEWIKNKCFEMKENMLMTFEGRSCNITKNNNDNNEPVGSYGSGVPAKQVVVEAGHLCFVLYGNIKFEKEEPQ